MAFSCCFGLTGEVKVPVPMEYLGNRIFQGCDVTLVEKEPTVTVTFDSNGGSGIADQTIESGKCISVPDVPIREGYTFLGWYLDDNEFDFDMPVTQNITLVAKWEMNPETEKPDGSGETETQKPDQTETNPSLPDQNQSDKDSEKVPSTEHTHNWSEWETVSEATVFHPQEQERRCSVCGSVETRSIGEKVSPQIKTNAVSFPLKVKQSTKKLKVTDLATGDYVKSWKSSNPKVVTVNQKGKITAKKKTGKATITITLASGIEKKITVKVQKAIVKTKKINVKYKKIELKKGEKYSLAVTVSPITSTQKLSYKPANKKIVSVSKKGVIKAMKEGKTKITIQSGNRKAVVYVTVKK